MSSSERVIFALALVFGDSRFDVVGGGDVEGGIHRVSFEFHV